MELISAEMFDGGVSLMQFLESFFNKTTVDIINKVVHIGLMLLVAKIMIYVLKKLISRIFHSKKFSERKSGALITLLSNVSKYTVYFFVIYSILNILFGTTVQSLLTIAGIGSVAVGFGAQSLVRDFITGFFIMLEDQFTPGDIVSIEGKVGIVETFGLRTTRIRGFDGDMHIIPNGEIAMVTNKSLSFTRAIVDVNVSYKENLDRVNRILSEELSQFASQDEKVRGEPKVLGVVSLAEGSVTIRMLIECEVKEDARIERDIRRRVKDRFDKEGIIIPYNQMVVHMAQQDVQVSNPNAR